MPPLISVPVHISWDFSFHNFNEVSVLYRGLQVRNTFSFSEYMNISKVLGVETRVCFLENRRFPLFGHCGDPWQNDHHRAAQVGQVCFLKSLIWEHLSLMLGAWALPALLPAVCFPPACSAVALLWVCRTRVPQLALTAQDQGTATSTYTNPTCSTRVT